MGVMAIVNARKGGKGGGGYLKTLKNESLANLQSAGIMAGAVVGASIATSFATQMLVTRRVAKLGPSADPKSRNKAAGNSALLVSGLATVAGLLISPLSGTAGMALIVTGAAGLARQAVGFVDKKGRLASAELEATASQYRMDPNAAIEQDPGFEGLERDYAAACRASDRELAADVNPMAGPSGPSSIFQVG